MEESASGFNYMLLFGTMGMLALTIGVAFLIIIVNVKEKKRLLMNYSHQITKAKLEIQEQIFDTISKEIHDNVGQNLSLAKVQVSIMEQNQRLDNDVLTDLKNSLSDAMKDLRDIAKCLSPERVRISNLVEMTECELSRLDRLGILRTSFRIEGIETDLQEQKRFVIFRIIQECLQNVIKHSKAKRVDIHFNFTNENFQCVICDDGVGFDGSSLDKKKGSGLTNIISRVTLIGGKAAIDSTISKGTTVNIILPNA